MSTSKSKPYVCDKCNYSFNKRTNFKKHNKKSCCIGLFDGFKDGLIILQENEGLTGGKAILNMSYFISLKTIEPLLGDEIDIYNYDYDLDENRKNELLEMVSFSNLAKKDETNLSNNLKDLWDNILSHHPSTKNMFAKGNGFNIKYDSTYKQIINKLNLVKLSVNELIEYDEFIDNIITSLE